MQNPLLDPQPRTGATPTKGLRLFPIGDDMLKVTLGQACPQLRSLSSRIKREKRASQLVAPQYGLRPAKSRNGR